jgi:hypothetical protein
VECCVWQEDDQRNFITYIPPYIDIEDHNLYYCFDCSSFDSAARFGGADLRSGILTYHTKDDSTTYWVNLGATSDAGYISTYRGGYNNNACFLIQGGTNEVTIAEMSYDDCKKTRGP